MTSETARVFFERKRHPSETAVIVPERVRYVVNGTDDEGKTLLFPFPYSLFRAEVGL